MNIAADRGGPSFAAKAGAQLDGPPRPASPSLSSDESPRIAATRTRGAHIYDNFNRSLVIFLSCHAHGAYIYAKAQIAQLCCTRRDRQRYR
jgi:hypothetical protein